VSLFWGPQRPQSKPPLSSTRGASRVRGCRSLLGSSAFADALLSGSKLLYGSRALLGSRLLGGFFLVRSVLSGSCLALLGSGSLLDGGLLRGLFDWLATRRCCVAGLTLLSFRGGNLYIQDPSFLFGGAKKREISSTAGSTSASQFSTNEATNIDSDTGNWVTQSQVGRNRH
jgi:hypothetical protein